MTSSVYALCLFWRQRAKDLAAEWVCVFKKKQKKNDSTENLLEAVSVIS